MSGETGVVWGKWPDGGDPYPVLAHLVGTAAMASALWECVVPAGLREVIREHLGEPGGSGAVLAFAAGVHDVGKYEPYFQG